MGNAASSTNTASGGGAASLRSLKTVDAKTASTGMITQQMQILTKTNSKQGLDLKQVGDDSKPKTPLGGARGYQHISVSPARFGSAAADF